MTKRKIEIELDNDDEIIQRDVKVFGSSSHIIIPLKHKSKKAMIIINKKKEV